MHDQALAALSFEDVLQTLHGWLGRTVEVMVIGPGDASVLVSNSGILAFAEEFNRVAPDSSGDQLVFYMGDTDAKIHLARWNFERARATEQLLAIDVAGVRLLLEVS